MLEEGAGLDQVEQIFKEFLHNLFESMQLEDDWHEHHAAIEMLIPCDQIGQAHSLREHFKSELDGTRTRSRSINCR
jgi:hypothetical protein